MPPDHIPPKNRRDQTQAKKASRGEASLCHTPSEKGERKSRAREKLQPTPQHPKLEAARGKYVPEWVTRSAGGCRRTQLTKVTGSDFISSITMLAAAPLGHSGDFVPRPLSLPNLVHQCWDG